MLVCTCRWRSIGNDPYGAHLFPLKLSRDGLLRHISAHFHVLARRFQDGPHRLRSSSSNIRRKLKVNHGDACIEALGATVTKKACTQGHSMLVPYTERMPCDFSCIKVVFSVTFVSPFPGMATVADSISFRRPSEAKSPSDTSTSSVVQARASKMGST